MKLARTLDYWRAIDSDSDATRLEEFLIDGISSLGVRSIVAKGPLTVLCGANGTGKSTILEALYMAINGCRPSFSFGGASKLNGAKLQAHIKRASESGKFNLEGGIRTAECTGEFQISWLNPGAASAFLQHEFSSKSNFSEILDGISERGFSDTERSEISYLVGKEYSAVRVWEIEADEGVPTYAGAEYLYYFKVTADGVEYGAEDMGLGEYALFLLHWESMRLQAGSMLLIEELESHISHRSQIHALNFLAKRCMDVGLWTLVTTHSPAILRVVPEARVLLCYKAAGKTWIKANPIEIDLSDALGVKLQKKGFFLLEDAAAKAFFLGISAHRRREFRVFYEVLVATGGSSRIDALRYDFPSISGGLKIIGIYDADAEIPKKDYKHAAISLPGTRSPELEVIGSLQSNSKFVAERLGKTKDQIDLILSNLAGGNEHDWFVGFVQQLDLNYDSAMNVAVAAWLETPANESATNIFFHKLAALTK